MKKAIFDGLKRWNEYSGRSDRRQFWWFYLFFLLMPFVCVAVSLAYSWLISLLNLDSLSSFSFVLGYLYLALVPSMIAVQVRRMHDVGKSGWLILIPLYNHYLYVQPSVERGRIPNWILAERVSLGFVGILAASLLSGNVENYLSGLVFWSAIYLLIKRKNTNDASSR
jgi:uncharacterized membrane protein YhaH (DUF805 family)